jgi:prevent-host-death family protein
MDTQPRSSVRTMNAVKARERFGQLLDEVFYRGDVIIIERAGRPMAALIPLSVLEELQHHHGQPKPDTDSIKERKRMSKKRRA